MLSRRASAWIERRIRAVLQDNRAALIVGAPTGGAGCGHTDGGTPTTLAHSCGVLKLPDCARLRANGDNEAAGLQPDLLIGFRRYDGVERQAKFLSEKLPLAVLLAAGLKRYYEFFEELHAFILFPSNSD